MERGGGINGGGSSADGNRHVGSLEHDVGKVAIGRGGGMDGRDGVTRDGMEEGEGLGLAAWSFAKHAVALFPEFRD